MHRRHVLSLLGSMASGALARGARARQPDAGPQDSGRQDSPDASSTAASSTSESSKAGPLREELRSVDLKLAGDPKLARRAQVLVPQNLARGERVSALILLHGLGETGNEERGIQAWGKDYGLVEAVRRLHQPPLTRVNTKERFVDAAWLERVNARLEREPTRPLVFICPVTPNPHGSSATLDAYAEWIEDVLLPGVNDAVPELCLPHNLGLAGCSLGGYVALEMYLRKPELFSSLGLVQAAMGVWRAQTYLKRLVSVAEQQRLAPIHLLSSTQDPYREAAETLSHGLTSAKLFHEFEVLPGPHSQPWLREAGAVATVHWHDRVLNGARWAPCDARRARRSLPP